MTAEKAESNRLSPAEAFDMLSDETRLEIIQTLWERDDPAASATVSESEDPPEEDAGVSFSELYERVGYDDTGNFNYHLSKLTDHFVHRTETGYKLTEAGVEIARSIIAGTVHERPSFDTEEIDAACPLCDAPVVVGYENRHVSAACSRCRGIWQCADGEEAILFRFPVPPAGLSGRTREELFDATLEYTLHRIRSSLDGVCPDCSSALEQSLDICETHDSGDRGGCPQCHRQHAIEVADSCPRCKSVSRIPLTIAILAHPTVTAFYHDHGIEHRFASWETFRRGQTVEAEVVKMDPLCIRVTVPCEEDELRLTLDESLSVVDVSR